MLPLVRRDTSDCTNSDVTAGDPCLVGGLVNVTVVPDGDIDVEALVTSGTPNTSYGFYLKCVKQLFVIPTDSRGIGWAFGHFDPALVGATFAFDMYPEDAPSGNTYQSTQAANDARLQSVDRPAPPLRASAPFSWQLLPLVKRDTSDCTNSDVRSDDPCLIAGNVFLYQEGNLFSPLVTITNGTPNTTYQFFLKCVKQLFSVTTDDRGVGWYGGTFHWSESPVGDTFAFDLYPEGAPSGNVYQSTQAKKSF